ncbi:MAG: helix-turn-helix domain-containing protein, partial [Candidatus Doudnabacteria bacterium]|nr:helix-turn-helix domain-containing protein [Candidatus Doudnabacteria bacterium]
MDETKDKKFSEIGKEDQTRKTENSGIDFYMGSEAENSQPAKEEFMSLSEASKSTGYHQDYLGFLCRTGKLKGFKIGRNWVTTKSNLDEFIKNYKNGISEVMDETGNKIQVHILANKKTEAVKLEAPEAIQPVVAIPVPAVKDAEPLAQPSLKLNELKNEVFENIEQRIKNLSDNLNVLETKVVEKEKNQLNRNSEKEILPVLGTNSYLETEYVLPPTVAAASDRPRLSEKFASNLSFEAENISENKSVKQVDSKLVLTKNKVKELYQSFAVPKAKNLPLVFASLALVILGIVASTLLSNFVTEKRLAQTNDVTKIFYSDSGKSSLPVVQNSTSTTVIVNRNGGTQIINKLLGLNESQVYNLIDQRLNQYLAEGKFKGDKGDAGAQGLPGGSSTITYIQPSSGSGGGSMTGFTYLSAQDFITNNATVNNQLTVNGNTNLNGNTVINNLTVGNFNTGFLAGSVIFQGANGLAQDNSNFYFNASTTQLSLGTNSPSASAILQLNSTSTGFLAPRMTQAERDAIVSPASGLLVYNTNTNQYNVFNGTSWVAVGSGGSGTGSGSVGTGTPGSFAYYPSATDEVQPQQVLFVSGNNIGIGSNTPSSRLTVVSTSTVSNILTLASTTGTSLVVVDANGKVGIGSATPSTLLAIQGKGTLDPFDVATVTGASLLRVSANGNVGVGTTTPGQTLTVAGTGLFTGNLTGLGNLNVSGQTTLGNASVTALTLAGSLYDSNNSSGTNGMILQTTGTGTQWVATSSLGIVGGIQTINGLSSLNQTLATNTTATGLTQTITSTGSTHTFNLSLTPGYVIPLSASTTEWSNFYATPSTRITAGTGLAWSGNTLNASNAFTGSGINGQVAYWNSATGLTSSSALLHNGTVVGVNATSSNINLLVQGTGSNTPFQVNSSTGSSLLTVLPNGNVGIGTATPAELLQVGDLITLHSPVGGSVRRLGFNMYYDGSSDRYMVDGLAAEIRFDKRNTGSLKFNIATSSTAGSLVNVVTAINIASTGIVGFNNVAPVASVDIKGIAGKNPFRVTSSSNASLFVIDQLGNVGIGTATPAYSLDVNGNSRFVGNITVNGNTIFGNSGYQISSSGVALLNTVTAFGSGNNIFFGNTGIGTSTPTAQLAVVSTSTTQTALLVQGIASQTSNLLVVASSTGSSLFTVAANGSTTVSNLGTGIVRSSNGSLYTDASTYLTSAITSLNGQTGSSQTFATGTATGIGLTITSAGNVHTFTPTVSSGYSIPLTASTTNWNTAYNIVNASSTFWDTAYTNRITSATAPLQISSNTIGLQAGYNIPLTASTTQWANFYNNPISFLNAGSNIVLSGTSTIAVSANPSFTSINTTNASTTNLTVSNNTYLATTTATRLIFTNASGTALSLTGNINAANLSGTNTGDVTLTGQNYLSLSGQQITANQINLASHVTGVLPIANGGTGTSTIGADDTILVSNGTNYNFASLPACDQASQKLIYSTTTNSFLCSGDAGAGGGITSLNLQTGSSQTFATSTSGGLSLFITSGSNVHTFTLSPAAGYSIPLSASTTEWSNFYAAPSTRITAGTGLAWSGNILNSTNTFTGSGTNGYVTRWASSTGLTTGVLLDNGTVAGVNATSSTASFLVQGTGSRNAFQVNSSTGTSLLTVLPNGNVGIGNVTPTQALELVASSGIKLTSAGSLGVVLKSNDSTIGLDGLTIRNKDDNAYGSISSAGFFSAYSGVNNSGGFMNNDFSLYRTAVNVNDTGTVVTASTGQYGWSPLTGFGFLSQTNDTGLARNSAGVVKVTDGSTGWGNLLAGQIGINTTTPEQKLVVVGDARITGALFDSNNASGTNGMILQTTGTGTQWVATSSLGIVGGIQTINGLSSLNQTLATNTTATGLTQTITSTGSTHTFNLSLTPGYVIPLSASTTNWNTAYNIVNASSTFWDTAYTNRITSATAPLQISSNTIGLQAG